MLLLLQMQFVIRVGIHVNTYIVRYSSHKGTDLNFLDTYVSSMNEQTNKKANTKINSLSCVPHQYLTPP